MRARAARSRRGGEGGARATAPRSQHMPLSIQRTSKNRAAAAASTKVTKPNPRFSISTWSARAPKRAA